MEIKAALDMQQMIVPATIEDVQSAVRDSPPGARISLRGAGTKPILSEPTPFQEGRAAPSSPFSLHAPPSTLYALNLSHLSRILEYDPGEFTFTALAGTPVAQVQALLAEHGQYLPFDPPLAGRGATLGGTIAAGLSGPGRYRYGGARDFLLGVRFVDGEGRLVRGGGKVVKNAAGFDIPKLMVGSLGAYGALVELSFKVFPKPEAFATVRLERRTAAEAVESLQRLTASQLDIDSLDLEMSAAAAVLWVRLGGLANALPARLDCLCSLLEGGDVLQGGEEAALWNAAREFDWAPPGWSLVKVPVTPGRIVALDAALAATQSLRRYSAGGQVVWLATPDAPEKIDSFLTEQSLSGLRLFGPPGPARLGLRTGEGFARRVKGAFDPNNRFVDIGEHGIGVRD